MCIYIYIYTYMFFRLLKPGHSSSSGTLTCWAAKTHVSTEEAKTSTEIEI